MTLLRVRFTPDQYYLNLQCQMCWQALYLAKSIAIIYLARLYYVSVWSLSPWNMIYYHYFLGPLYMLSETLAPTLVIHWCFGVQFTFPAPCLNIMQKKRLLYYGILWGIDLWLTDSPHLVPVMRSFAILFFLRAETNSQRNSRVYWLFESVIIHTRHLTIWNTGNIAIC